MTDAKLNLDNSMLGALVSWWMVVIVLHILNVAWTTIPTPAFVIAYCVAIVTSVATITIWSYIIGEFLDWW